MKGHKMKTYHKIQTVFKREENAGRGCPVVEGNWAKPEFYLLRDIDWVMTEKVDGTNIRIIWDGDTVTIKGKTDRAQIPTFLLDKLQERFTVEKMKNTFQPNYDEEHPIFTLYGEGYGRKIQKGGGNYIPDGVDFILFDVKYDGPTESLWFVREFCEGVAKSLNIPIVPIVHIGPLKDAVDMCKYGFSSHLRLTPPEGLILKPKYELQDRRGNRIISKLKLSDFRK